MIEEKISRAEAILSKFFGYRSFRSAQRDVITSIIRGKDTLAIMPTGAGKSLCFQIPALLNEGITIVVSPLISLMKDQVDSLTTQGISSTFINSTLTGAETVRRINDVAAGLYKLVYVAPERLDTESFTARLTEINVSMVAVDEAHCLSQWGHDFRPSYRAIAPFIACLKVRPLVAAFTATATPEVRDDILRLLKMVDPDVHVSGFDRPNLYFSVYHGSSEAKRKFILDYIHTHSGESGIIYAMTRKTVDKLCEFLRRRGIATSSYHAGLDDTERATAQDDFLYDRIQVIVATNAFGMGIDKSNVRFVIHFNMPKNIEAYYQEAGRAGRDGEHSECILLFADSDYTDMRFLLSSSTENEERLNYNYRLLGYMNDYAHTSECLRGFILRYFGEQDYPKNCGSCGNCVESHEKIDATVDAQKVLSCILRMKKRYGLNYGTSLITQVLRGSKDKRVLELRFNELSTYGLFKERSRLDVKNLIQNLISLGFINATQDQYPVLKLSAAAFDVLRGNERVFIPLPSKLSQQGRDKEDNTELFNSLRTLRKEIAESEGVPPYVVFSDATLRDMINVKPKTLPDMLGVTGIGEYKLKKYGQRFLDTLLESQKTIQHILT